MSSLRRRRPAPLKSRDLLLGELALAAGLVDRGDISAAIDLVEDIAAAHPGRAEPYELLVGLYLEVQDALGLEQSADRLTELRPDDQEAQLALATGHVAAGRIVMALRRLDQFLERWPQAPQVPDLKALRDELQRDGLPMVFEALGLEGERAAATALLHERIAFFSEHGRLPEARRSAERLLRENPDYVPGLNNYSQILALQGDLSRSVEVAERALQRQPVNPHALAHLVKGHLLLGHADQAEDAWQRLIRIETSFPDWVNKQAEAGSFLGKDAEVYALKRRVEPLSVLRDVPTGGYLLHLLAAAAFRIGEEKEARRLWKEALRVAPGLPMAEDNLEDLKRPAGERHAPWPFSLPYWLPSEWMEKLGECEDRIMQAPDEASQRTLVRRLLKEVPALRRLMPVLLERGDPLGRSLMLVLALTQNDPETAAVLRDFALDRWGPDALRIQAAQRAVELGVLEPGSIRVWSQGEQRDLLLLGFEVHGDATEDLKPAALRHLETAALAITRGEVERAEEALREALQADPRAEARVLYSRALIRNVQGRAAEAEELARQSHEADPDYLFARTALATSAAQKGDFQEAANLLQPVLRRKRLHYSELRALCSAQAQVLMAQKLWDGARDWLDMWEQMDPENPEPELLRKRLPRAKRGKAA